VQPPPNKKQKLLNYIIPYKLDEIGLPLSSLETDPLHWWWTNRDVFPTLSKIARKYLSISATSVPSEHIVFLNANKKYIE